MKPAAQATAASCSNQPLPFHASASETRGEATATGFAAGTSRMWPAASEPMLQWVFVLPQDSAAPPTRRVQHASQHRFERRRDGSGVGMGEGIGRVKEGSRVGEGERGAIRFVRNRHAIHSTRVVSPASVTMSAQRGCDTPVRWTAVPLFRCSAVWQSRYELPGCPLVTAREHFESPRQCWRQAVPSHHPLLPAFPLDIRRLPST